MDPPFVLITVKYFYDNNGNLHYCGQKDNEYDSDESGPSDDGIPHVISCSSNDDSDDDDDDSTQEKKPVFLRFSK